jgi:hypothetical protein
MCSSVLQLKIHSVEKEKISILQGIKCSLKKNSYLVIEKLKPYQ